MDSISHTSLVRSLTELSHESTLSCAIARHIGIEKASFHTPGHKGRQLRSQSSALVAEFEKRDLTELPGLDDLASPASTLRAIERRAARLWHSQDSVISVNGASAALIAAILALSGRGRKILIPRNAHRSAVSALVLSGLEPIWYEPIWDSKWGMYGAVSPHMVEQLLSECRPPEVALMLVTSPTYAGAVSDIEAIARACKQHALPLVVDEAHGAHFLPGLTGADGDGGSPLPVSAIELGATMVVHSLHKTLSAFTQCGILHIGHDSPVGRQEVRRALNLVQTSSPSYPLLASIEEAVALMESEGAERMVDLARLALDAKNQIESLGFDVFKARFLNDPLHLVISSPRCSATELFDFLSDRGVFAEAILGRGVLLLMGVGSREEDVSELLLALTELSRRLSERPPTPLKEAPVSGRLQTMEQVFSPRAAFFMPSEVVAASEAVGRVAGECIAPCPPGIPICVPGQRIGEDILTLTDVKSLRVVCEPIQTFAFDSSTRDD